jgi:hypothetical protein
MSCVKVVNKSDIQSKTLSGVTLLSYWVIVFFLSSQTWHTILVAVSRWGAITPNQTSLVQTQITVSLTLALLRKQIFTIKIGSYLVF